MLNFDVLINILVFSDSKRMKLLLFDVVW